mmetsp:Transcript_4480/g.7504  ORF Transcript_4480/g.7504 Transcript_4480/m.7504 type:complete len:118 (-) Transcript_4480:194-547(-)
MPQTTNYSEGSPLAHPYPERLFVGALAKVVCGALAATLYPLLWLGLAHGPAVCDGGLNAVPAQAAAGHAPCTIGFLLSSVWLFFLCVVVLWSLLLVSVASAVCFFFFFNLFIYLFIF